MSEKNKPKPGTKKITHGSTKDARDIIAEADKLLPRPPQVINTLAPPDGPPPKRPKK